MNLNYLTWPVACFSFLMAFNALVLADTQKLNAIPKGLAEKDITKGEPTNADEAAKKKMEQDAKRTQQYHAIVEKMTPAQQAWEKTLQENLGNFYLPHHMNDKIAGKSNAWDFVEDAPNCPRVLLIGDSVSRGYTQPTRQALSGKINVHRAPANCGPTASGLKNLKTWLGDGKWDLIHFNFGIHDRKTPLEIYEKNLETLIGQLQATGAKLVWASTTPIPDDAKQKQTATSIIERNEVAAKLMQKHGIAVDDLFASITPHLKDMQLPNDVHFKPAGYEFLGQQVAKSLLEHLSLMK